MKSFHCKLSQWLMHREHLLSGGGARLKSLDYRSLHYWMNADLNFSSTAESKEIYLYRHLVC